MRIGRFAFILGMFGGSAFAEDINVTTAASSMKVGGEFRSEWMRHDRGLEKTQDMDPDATMSVGVSTVKLKIAGNINKETEYKFRFNLLNPTTSPLDYGFGTHWCSEMFGVSMGRMKVLQGGWDNWDNNGFTDHVQGVYAKNFAFSKFTDMMAFTAKVAGKIQFQIFDDVVSTQAGDGRWNKTKSPTFALGWMGHFSGIEPIVNMGFYDSQKSNWMDIGVKGSFAETSFRADLIQHRVNKKGEANGVTTEMQNVATTATVKVAYALKDMVTPSIYYSAYNMKDDVKDVTYNKYDAEKKEYKWNDQGSTYALAVDVTALGKGWTPFFAYVGNSGKWQDPRDATIENSKSESMLKIGVLGDF